MVVKEILLVYKKSAYHLYVKKHGSQAVRQAIESNDPVARQMLKGHDVHSESLRRIEQILKLKKKKVYKQWRGKMRNYARFDLIITVGGDGTLLDISHWVQNTPILGINSDPQRSVGKLCSIHVDQLEETLDKLESGELAVEKFNRLSVSIDGESYLGPCLNDILIAHPCPAEMTRFQIFSGDEPEEIPVVRSSGIWISTAIGSTAALYSAGGKILDKNDNSISYAIREPYNLPLSVKKFNTVEEGDTLTVVNRSRAAMIWADGSHHSIDISYGQVIEITNGIPIHLVSKVV